MGRRDALKFAKSIQHKVDLLHVSVGNLYHIPSIAYMIQPTYLPLATNVRYAELFKKALDIPVTTVGSFTMELAEQAIASGQADMVAMIRSFVADPDVVNKARLGRGSEIRPCIRCCICTGDDPHGCPKPLRCAVNPVSGRNLQFDLIPKSETSKKVVVIGGGAGGMEAARRLQERGHRVVLFEKTAQLGGTLLAASANKLKSDIKRYTDWSIRMTEQTPGIDVRLNTEATSALVSSEKPDAVILAAGSTPFIPPIPGIHGENVCLAVDVDLGKASVGQKIVLIGAGLTGTETAVVLAQEGHDVTVIDMLPLEVIDGKGAASRSIIASLRGMSEKARVKVLTGLKAERISKTEVTARSISGELVTLPCDTVVLSMGVKPRSELIEEFRAIAHDFYVIGDCNSAMGNITSAVREGFYAAMNI